MVVEAGAAAADDEAITSVVVGFVELTPPVASRLYSAVLELVKSVATEDTSKVCKPWRVVVTTVA